MDRYLTQRGVLFYLFGKYRFTMVAVFGCFIYSSVKIKPATSFTKLSSNLDALVFCCNYK